MTMPLDVQQDIREMDRDGVPRSRIARELHVSRNTVAKYADMADMSPRPPMPQERRRPVMTQEVASWIDGVLEADLSAPRKQRHTAKRIYDRLVEERGYEGSYSTVRRHVAAWRLEHARPADGYLELVWSPGTCQVDFGNFRCVLAGAARDTRLLVLTLPHSNARFAVAMFSERAECLCQGPGEIFEWMGRAPRIMVPGNATEAGRMAFGKVTESKLFSQFRAHYCFAARFRDPYSGNEKGSVENAVGFLRRNLLVPVPEAGSLAGLNGLLRKGCERTDASSRNRQGAPTPEAMREDLAAMRALPGTAFDAAGWQRARSDKRGYVRIDSNPCCAGPAWHDRELVCGARAGSVEILADRGRHVATLRRSFGEGEVVRNPLSLVPALIARPRAFGESTTGQDMPDELVGAMDRCDKQGRRQALRALERASAASGFDAACEAERRIFATGRVPDASSCDVLARRIASGDAEGAGPDLAVYDGFPEREAMRGGCR